MLEPVSAGIEMLQLAFRRCALRMGTTRTVMMREAAQVCIAMRKAVAHRCDSRRTDQYMPLAAEKMLSLHATTNLLVWMT